MKVIDGCPINSGIFLMNLYQFYKLNFYRFPIIVKLKMDNVKHR